MQNSEIPSSRSAAYKTRKSGWKWARIKSLIRSQLARSPKIENLVVQLWRKSRFLFVRGKWKLNALLGSMRGTYVRDIDVNKIYWVSPQKITFSGLQEFRFCDYKGLILGGDWDRLEKRFDSLDLYIAIKQVCLEGKNWADTLYYCRTLDEFKKGGTPYGCHDERDLQKKCQNIESLYKKIQLEGYKSQRELYDTGANQDPLLTDYEVTVSIGRDGDLLFSSGAHRLAIARLLNIPTIPVTVSVRHKHWIKLRNELLLYAREDPANNHGRLYQAITHPDLSDIPAGHECVDRFKLIEDHLSFKQGRLLDIGANLGYFCHRFEEKGFDCYAVENFPSTVYFLKRLARAENRSFKIISESVLDNPEIKNTRFNVVLALNIFHHFLKNQADFEKFVDLLKKLQMDELFFEPHLPDEPQMEGAYKNFPPDEFVHFILANSCLEKAVMLGTMPDGRSLYKLY